MTIPWRAEILTLFPEMFPGPLGVSLVGRALDSSLWTLEATNIRDFATGRHASVDDTPAGGGAGMVLRADVAARAFDHVVERAPGLPAIYLTPRGAPLTQQRARGLAAGRGVMLVCGRFEGIDERFIEARGVEEISLGDFILSGGEIAAMALIDAAVRLLPGVVGDAASLAEESFEGGLLEYPHFTRPGEWEGRAIPEILLSGHHGKIEAWRRRQAEAITRARRPDLWAAYTKYRDRGDGG